MRELNPIVGIGIGTKGDDDIGLLTIELPAAGEECDGNDGGGEIDLPYLDDLNEASGDSGFLT